MESEGRRIHGEAAKAREDGHHLESLKLEDEAMLAYQRDSDLLGVAEIIADRAINLRHLFESTNDKAFLLIAEAENKAAIEIAKLSGDQSALAIPYFNLGKVQDQLEKYSEASESFQKALDNMEDNPPEAHGKRDSIIADMKIHLSAAQYKLGDKSALGRALQAISDLEAVKVVTDEEFESRGKKLENDEEVKYNRDVWLSGAYMHVAEILRGDDPEKAKEHLQKAKEIIDQNPDLKLRKAQWEKLAETFK